MKKLAAVFVVVALASCVNVNARVHDAALKLQGPLQRLNRLTAPKAGLSAEDQAKVVKLKAEVEEAVAAIVTVTTPKGE